MLEHRIKTGFESWWSRIGRKGLAAETAGCVQPTSANGRFLPIFFLSLFVLLLISQQLFIHAKIYFEGEGYPTTEAMIVNLKKACDPDRTIILGDSGALQGIDPRLLGPSVLNTSLGGSSPVEAYLIAKNLWKCDVYPKKVILSFNAYHFYHSNGYWPLQQSIATPADRIRLRLDSYRLRDASIYSVWPLVSPFTADLRFAPPDRMGEFLEEIQFPSIYLPNFKRFIFTQQAQKNRDTFRFMTQESQGYYTRGEGDGGRIVAAQLDANEQFAPLPLIDAYFDKLLVLLRARGIQVYYLQMPISELRYQTQKEAFRQEFIAYINEKSRRFGMKILGKLIVTYPDATFIDDSHFKNSGAQAFTHNIAGLIPPPN